MTTTPSPSLPVAGNTVTLTQTRTVNGFDIETRSPQYELTSVAPGCKLATRRRITMYANPSGRITSVSTGPTSRREFGVSLSDVAGYFTRATIEFTSGTNKNKRARVSSHTLGSFFLTEDLPAPPVVGDQFVITDEELQKVSFVPDVAGTYELQATVLLEYADGRTQVVGVETASIEVGATLELPIRAGANGITIRLRAHGETITSAELVRPRSEVDRLAALDATVQAKLAALVGVDVVDLGPDLPVDAAALRTAYEAHRVLTSGSVHVSADTTNAYLFGAPTSKTAAIDCVNLMRVALVGHLAHPVLPGPWHTDDDTKNVPHVLPASTLGQAVVLYADLRRCYERHRVQIASPASHGAADNTNVLGAVDPQSDLIIAYLDYVTSVAPPVPANVNPAQVSLPAQYGFEIVG